MSRQINSKPEKPLTRQVLEKELDRVKGILRDYKVSEEERKFFDIYIDQLYSELDKRATKKQAQEANL